jgi:hypothetical protein
MNYYLSVIPYFGAVAAGVAPPIKLAPFPANDPLYEPFCTAPESCPELVAPWRDYFTLLNSTKDSCSQQQQQQQQQTALSAVHLDPRSPTPQLDYELTPQMDRLLASLWAAHLHSIQTALPFFTQQLAAMSSGEAKFGRSWAGIVDLIAAAHFPVNNTITNLLQNLLPPRLILESDPTAALPLLPSGHNGNAQNSHGGRDDGHNENHGITGFTFLQSRALWAIDEVYTANATSRGEIAKLWEAGMCVDAGRALGREILTLGFYRLSLLGETGVKLAERMVKDSVHKVQCD